MLQFFREMAYVIEMMMPWILMGAVLMGVLHVTLPTGFFRRATAGRRGVARAVFLGVPLPLCSCGVIPVAVGMRRSGSSKSATMAFLVSTPQTGVDSLLVTGGFFGWTFALYRVAVAALMGLASGHVLNYLGSEDAEAKEILEANADEQPGWRDGLSHAWMSLSTIWGWVVVGVVVSGLLGVWGGFGEADSWIKDPLWGTFAALVVSLPLYVCATASIPIASALVVAGMPVQAALVFLVAGPATNLATIGAVHSELGKRSLVVYLTVTIVGSVLASFAFGSIFTDITVHAHHMDEAGVSWTASASLGAFFLITLGWLRQKYVSRPQKTGSTGDEFRGLEVTGMTCQGCVRRLSNAFESEGLALGKEVNVELGRVTVLQEVSVEKVEAVIGRAGFGMVSEAGSGGMKR